MLTQSHHTLDVYGMRVATAAYNVTFDCLFSFLSLLSFLVLFPESVKKKKGAAFDSTVKSVYRCMCVCVYVYAIKMKRQVAVFPPVM